MTGDYIPQVGDRVRRSSWAETEWLDVLCVGGQQVFGIDNEGEEWCPDLDGDEWINVVNLKPLPERWSNVYPDGFWQSHTTAMSARVNSHDGRIATLHIWTDADGVDHTEIERVEQ